jgi:hypothetical protein
VLEICPFRRRESDPSVLALVQSQEIIDLLAAPLCRFENNDHVEADYFFAHFDDLVLYLESEDFAAFRDFLGWFQLRGGRSQTDSDWPPK